MTEPDYFRAYRIAYYGTLIDIISNNPGSDPLTVAEAAATFVKERNKRKLNSYEENDQVWVVFDRDNHPPRRLNEAKQLSKAHGIGIAFSNPCFELWLILHEVDYNRPDGRQKVQAYYGKLRPEYDSKQRKCPDSADVVKRVEDAVLRAERQLGWRQEDGAERPLTTVFQMIQEIQKAAEKARRR